MEPLLPSLSRPEVLKGHVLCQRGWNWVLNDKAWGIRRAAPCWTYPCVLHLLLQQKLSAFFAEKKKSCNLLTSMKEYALPERMEQRPWTLLSGLAGMPSLPCQWRSATGLQNSADTKKKAPLPWASRWPLPLHLHPLP